MNLNTEKELDDFKEFVNLGKRSASDFDKLAYISAEKEKITVYKDLYDGKEINNQWSQDHKVNHLHPK